MLPSEYFKRQIYATTWFEQRNIAALVEAVGEDNILFETDFPHPTCLYPDPLATADINLAEPHPGGSAQDHGRERRRPVPALIPDDDTCT